MRIFLLKLMCILAVGFFATSCSNEKEMGLEDPNATAEVSFELNLLGNPNEETKAFTTEEGICATQADLETLANAGNLNFNVLIGTTNYVKKIRWTGTKFISDPILLPAGTYSANQATVTNGSYQVLFSAVANPSPYVSYVPEILPKTFTIGSNPGDIPLYQKTSIDIYMLCVLKETAEKFGFIKWNIHFTKLYCVPFIINICKDKEHFIASGSLNIQNGTYNNNIFTPATGNESPVKFAVINKTVNFTAPSNPLPEICFADNYEIPNNNEWYKFTLTITTPVSQTFIGYANAATLIQYNNTNVDNAWDAANNVIHFDFCNNKTWFFPNQPEGPGIDIDGTIWAEGNIYLNEKGQLDFGPQNMNGLFFKWGSLVGVGGPNGDPNFYGISFKPASDPTTYSTWSSIKYATNAELNIASPYTGIDDGFINYNGGTGYNASKSIGDVCRYMSNQPGWTKGKWRLPTIAESEAMYAVSQAYPTTLWQDIYNSAVYPNYNSGRYAIYYGRFFGPNIANPNDQMTANPPAQNLFLPAAGTRKYTTGELFLESYAGRYWSAAPITSTIEAAAGLEFAQQGVNSIGGVSRDAARTVRCVRDK